MCRLGAHEILEGLKLGAQLDRASIVVWSVVHLPELTGKPFRSFECDLEDACARRLVTNPDPQEVSDRSCAAAVAAT